jgi:hypothetical protein
MLRIRNISRTGTASGNYLGFKVKGIGTSGLPGYVALEPTQQVMFPRLAVTDWHPSAKQALADFVSQGILEVAEVDSSHLYMDKGNNLVYNPMDYLVVSTTADALARAITLATDFHAKLDAHVANMAVHTAATAGFVGGPPTSLATLILWLAAARLVYETNHRPSAAAHPSVDTSNVPVLVPPVDTPTCVQELRNLAMAYTSHKTWVLEATAVVLNVPGILTY